MSGPNVQTSIFEHFYRLSEAERIEYDSLVKPSENQNESHKEVKDYFFPAIVNTPENKIKFSALLKTLR